MYKNPMSEEDIYHLHRKGPHSKRKRIKVYYDLLTCIKMKFSFIVIAEFIYEMFFVANKLRSQSHKIYGRVKTRR